MKDKLVKDWKRIISLSFSFWGFAIIFLIATVPEAIFILTGVDYDPYVTQWAVILVSAFGGLGRIFIQSNNVKFEWLKIVSVMVVISIISLLLSEQAYGSHFKPVFKQVDTKESLTLDIAVPLISKWEGKRNLAYLDKIARPAVWTVCYGETLGVKDGDYYTDKQCLSMLKKSVVKHRNDWLVYVNDKARREWIPATRDAAYTSLAYNVGARAAGRSTATRRLNSGNIKGGCQALTWWKKSGGRVIRGLVNRRADEYRLCMMA